MTRPRTLRESLDIAPEAAPAADPFGAETAAGKEAADAARCGLLVRVSEETRRDLKLAAIARGTTVQALMLEAVSLVLKPPAEQPAPQRPAGP